MKAFGQTERGITLIELLVVIAIIGLLASIVMASLNSARSKARDAKRLSDFKQIQLALELYRDANGQYPSAAPGGSGCWWNWQSGNTNGGSSQWLSALAPYLPTPPKESTIGGCVYRYVRFTGSNPSCGSTTYAALYMLLETPRSSPTFGQPSCMSSWGWGEATAADPNGILLLLPE